MTIFEKIDLRKTHWIQWVACAGLVATASLESASFTEPSTVFYGTITGTGGDRPFPVTEGELQWTLLRADGTTLPLRTQLRPLNEGAFSYRLDVPHEAISLGLETHSAASVPLASNPATNAHFRITVNGMLARLAEAGKTTFDADQVRRAATYQLDLEVPLAPTDTDQDGLPDWWEERIGTDKQVGGDADGDVNGDGLTNIQDFRSGSDGLRDARMPILMSTSLSAYAEGKAGVMLRVADADSTAAELVYSLLSLPQSGALYLRNAVENPEYPDLQLAVGSQFSHQDVLDGRLVFSDPEPASGLVSFDLGVWDQDTAHEASTASVALRIYEPATELGELSKEAMIAMAIGPEAPAEVSGHEDRQFRNYLLSKAEGFVIWDGSDLGVDQELIAMSSAWTPSEYASEYVSRFGPERPQVLIGGRGSDRLVGGMIGDHLIGGPGNDTLQGNGGPDRFVFEGSDIGNDAILDFSPADGDVVDLSRLFSGDLLQLHHYMQFTSLATGTVMQFDFDGTGGFADGTVQLDGFIGEAADLYRLVENGNLTVGHLRLRPRISLSTGLAKASENGPNPGEFVLLREGDLEQALEVNIAVSGSATNGTDYSTILEKVAFAPGVRSVKVPVLPYADSTMEPSETVEMILQSGEGYETASTNRAELQIRDLRAVVSIELLDPLALRGEDNTAQVRISRDVVLDRDLLLDLVLSGSAIEKIDFVALPKYLNFAPGQSSILLNIQPLDGGSSGTQDLRIAVVENDDFILDGAASAHLLIADETTTLDDWKTHFFPDSSENLDTFVHSFVPGSRISNLAKYAFGLDTKRTDLELKAALPRYKIEEGKGILTFRHPATIEDVAYIVEASSDMKSWHRDSSAIQDMGISSVEGDWKTHFFRIEPTVPNRFVRVRLDYNP